MSKPTKEQIEEWWRQALADLDRGTVDLMAELAYTAGRQAGMEEAAQACKGAAAQSQVTCDRLNTSKDLKERVSSLVALGAVEQAKKLESAIRAAMETPGEPS